MPIVFENGKALNEQEVRVLIKMMQGSYENHLARFKKLDDPCELRDMAIAWYTDECDNLEEKYLALAASDEVIRIEELVETELSKTNQGFIQGRTGNDIENRDELEFWSEAIDYMKDPVIQRLELGDSYREPRDIYHASADDFELADKPFEGIENIAAYNPNVGSIASLHEPRSGNSTTLKKANDDEGKKKRAMGVFMFDSAAELARIKSVELMNKQEINFIDLFEAFSSLNEFSRMGDKDGGKLRARNVQAGGVFGIPSAVIPLDIYLLLDSVADKMNQIKATEDENLRKTQAVQLAAFTYQMTLSEHVFNDGNGRTCRLLSDVILQSFGLPPHVPGAEETKLAQTLGKKMDFKKGAEVFLDGVKKSSEILDADKTVAALSKKYRERKPEKAENVLEDIEKLGRISELYKDNDRMLITCSETVKSLLEYASDINDKVLTDSLVEKSSKTIQNIIMKGDTAAAQQKSEQKKLEEKKPKAGAAPKL